jgi:hypothetical protein
MFINHTSRTVHCRIVYCGAVGTSLAQTFDHIHSRIPDDQRTPIQTGFDGPVYKSSFELTPQGLGQIRGYTIRLLLVGFETTDPGATGCDLSGFRDVDGVVFVARGATPAAYISQALHTLSGSLARIGYDGATFPLVVQLEDGADPAFLSRLFPLGDTPAIVASPAEGKGVFEVLKAVTRRVLLAMKDGLLRDVT